MTSNKNKVYIIAEIGVNHNGSISLAKKLIKKRKSAVPMLSNFKIL